MAQGQSPDEIETDANAVAEGVNQIATVLHEGILRRIGNTYRIGSDWADLLVSMHADGRNPLLTVLVAALSAAGGVVALLIAREIMVRRGARFGRLLRATGAILLAVVAVIIASRIVTRDVPTRQLIILWSGAAIVGLAGRHAFTTILSASWAPTLARRRLRRFSELVSAAFIWGVLGLATISTLRGLRASPGLIDIATSVLVSIPVLVISVFAYWWFRQPVTAAVAGPPPRTVGRLRFAIAWPFIAMIAAVGTFTALQISITVAHPLPGLPLLLTLLLLLLTPHIDAMLAEWARERERTTTDSVPLTALYRTSRFAFVLLALIAIGFQWALPALVALGVHSGEAEWRSISLAVIAVAAAWGWNATGIGFERLTRRGHQSAAHNDELHAPSTRLETLFPLLGGTARALIVLLAGLTILLLLGMNIWPIVTGLSVFGLAISFGSQTLVKDIVSGLFFLIDDAFRMGEYIETSGSKGTVERISIRSVSLRHPRGAIATVPYGQIGKIQNFSRDWVIEKLVFRVAFDTDVEQVRKLFKQIGAKLATDPEFADDLLETFKSQGIANVEDGTLLVRGKFKARAGKQFIIRRKVYLAVQQAFRDNGIVAAPKPVMMASPSQTATQETTPAQPATQPAATTAPAQQPPPQAETAPPPTQPAPPAA